MGQVQTDTVEKIESNTCSEALIKEHGSEKVIGMIHAFLLLKPLIQEALENEEKKIIHAMISK